MDEEFYAKQRELMTRVVAANDVVITTAAIPGRKAPVLVTAEMSRACSPARSSWTWRRPRAATAS